MVFRRFIFLVFWVWSAGVGWADGRVALVIGNSAYSAAPPLANPTNDARAVSQSLERLGFDVVLGLDQSVDEMRATVRDFSVTAEGADLALFFYAGHALQVGGRNYMLPIDASLERESDLDFAAIDLQLVLKQMERASKNSVVLLDACRDNPFETKLTRAMGVTRSSSQLGRGLAFVEINPQGGALIGFATDPGEVAYDGDGDHSPFTDALLTHMETPGLEINAMMTRVRAEVVANTERKQRPWSTSSLLNELYLAPEDAPVEPEADPLMAEIEAWRAAETAQSAEALNAFLDRYPEGVFSGLAREKLSAFQEPQQERTDILALAPPMDDTPEPAPSSEPLTRQDATRRLCPECPPTVAIAGGTFLMGSKNEAAERPVTGVQIQPMHMSVGEVTVGDYRAFVEATGRSSAGCFTWTAAGKMRQDGNAGWSKPGVPVNDASPVACVSWNDAKAYTEWLSAVSGLTVRLPSEAELEFAIRAGTSGEYPFDDACTVNGADASSRFAWRNTGCDDGFPDLATADDLVPNALGLVATSGNLWEWAGDCWNTSHRGAFLDGRARTSGNCSSRVLRGGSWDDPLENLRSSYRVGIPANRRQANVGFRVVFETADNAPIERSASLVPFPEDRRDRMRLVQMQLNRLNCDAGVADGVAGPQTEAAYERYLASRQISGYAIDSLDLMKRLVRDKEVGCSVD